MPKLRIIHGPRSGQEFVLSQPATTIGRTSDNQIVIPDMTVSRLHALIALENGHYFLIDKSKNGVRVNGRSVPRGVLKPGARIEIGPCILEFLA